MKRAPYKWTFLSSIECSFDCFFFFLPRHKRTLPEGSGELNSLAELPDGEKSQPAAAMSGGDVVCSGWLRKSPPEKKLRRYVSAPSRKKHNVIVLFWGFFTLRHGEARQTVSGCCKVSTVYPACFNNMSWRWFPCLWFVRVSFDLKVTDKYWYLKGARCCLPGEFYLDHPKKSSLTCCLCVEISVFNKIKLECALEQQVGDLPFPDCRSRVQRSNVVKCSDCCMCLECKSRIVHA